MRAIDADALKEDLTRFYDNEVTARKLIDEQPTIQPEITHEQAVAYLQSTGWMQEHDRQMMLDGVHKLTAQSEPHWIPVEQALPEEPFGCLVTVMDTDPVTMEEFENILPYFVGWDGEQWNDYDGEQCPFEVLAWWGLPEPYKEVET